MDDPPGGNVIFFERRLANSHGKEYHSLDNLGQNWIRLKPRMPAAHAEDASWPRKTPGKRIIAKPIMHFRAPALALAA